MHFHKLYPVKPPQITEHINYNHTYHYSLYILCFQADACCSPISHASATPMTSSDAGALTDPDILGPCDPGTQIQLNGIVWHETDQGNIEFAHTMT